MLDGILPLLDAVYEQAEPGGKPFCDCPSAGIRGLFDQLTDELPILELYSRSLFYGLVKPRGRNPSKQCGHLAKPIC